MGLSGVAIWGIEGRGYGLCGCQHRGVPQMGHSKVLTYRQADSLIGSRDNGYS